MVEGIQESGHAGRRSRARAAVLVSAALVLGPGAAVAAAPSTGAIAQKRGSAGCISAKPKRDACAKGRAFERPEAIVLSADGRSAYVASPILGLASLGRDPATGALTQRPGRGGCVSDLVSGCREGVAAGALYGLALSPDDRNLYTVGLDGLAVFDRDPATGALAQKSGRAGCFAGGIASSPQCTSSPTIDFPELVTVSPDGRNVYIGSFGDDVLTILDRDVSGALRGRTGRDGCLSPSGTRGRCTRAGFDSINAIVVSPDGHQVYVVGFEGMRVFDRDAGSGALRERPGQQGCVSDSGTGGRCANGKALKAMEHATISPDGRFMYVAASISDAIAIFDRDLATGTMTQKRGPAGCISDTGTGGRCVNGKALEDTAHVAISADGRNVYAGGNAQVAIFDRDAATGALTQQRGRDGCVSDSGSRGICANGRAMLKPNRVTVSPDGRNDYVAAHGSHAVAIFDRG